MPGPEYSTHAKTSEIDNKNELQDKNRSSVEIQSNAIHNGAQEEHDEKHSRNIKVYLSTDSIAFFLLGMLVGLPCTTITAAAKAMFTGVTGAYGLCAFVTAAITSFATPLFAHLIPYTLKTVILVVAGVASFGICTLGSNVAGPVVGTMLGGATYAFGSNTYLAVAASFPQFTVVSFSSGCGFSVVFGPALYIALMKPLDQSWKKVFWTCMALPIGMCPVWWIMLSSERRKEAERVRGLAMDRRDSPSGDSTESNSTKSEFKSTTPLQVEKSCPGGFGKDRSRLGLFFKIILPRYVVPLLLCTTSAITTMLGLSPTLQDLRSFKGSPHGDLQFEICYLAYGFGQFLFSTLSMRFKLTFIWGWAIMQIAIVVIGVIQLFSPFLKYYPAWVVFLFLVGGGVGGGVTNTNYKIADDFRRQGEPEEVRSFAMSYGGLGNFGGDALGGSLAILVEVLATKYLKKHVH